MPSLTTWLVACWSMHMPTARLSSPKLNRIYVIPGLVDILLLCL